MELFEQGIRHRLSSDQLIGCFFIEGAKRGFKDIRGTDGDPIEVEGNEDFFVDYDQKNLIEGEYYSFNWTVPQGSSSIRVTGDISPVNKDKFLETLYNVHKNSKSGK